MATYECQNNSLSLSDSSSESFYGFSQDTINYITLPQEARISTRKLEKIKKVSLKISFWHSKPILYTDDTTVSFSHYNFYN